MEETKKVDTDMNNAHEVPEDMDMDTHDLPDDFDGKIHSPEVLPAKTADDNEDEYGSLLSSCQKALQTVRASQNNLITAYYSLGKEILAKYPRKYGSGIVEKLSGDLGVYPQRIYECIQIAEKFTDIDKLKEYSLEHKLSWSGLIRKALPKPKKEKKKQSLSYWDDKISLWEKTFAEIENAASTFETVSPEIQDQIKGSLLAFQQSMDCFGFHQQDIHFFETPEIKNVLREIIDYDEVTGDPLTLEERNIHHITTRGAGGEDSLDNMIVVSGVTHSGAIATGVHKKEELESIVRSRNESLLEKLIIGKIIIKSNVMGDI